MDWLLAILLAFSVPLDRTEPPKHAGPPRVEAVRFEAPRRAAPRTQQVYKVADKLVDCPVSGRTDYDAFYMRSAQYHGAPEIDGISGACWEKGRAQIESGQLPTIASGAGAKGVMQLKPGTFADMGGTDIEDPAQNIDAGIKYAVWCWKMWRAQPRTNAERKPLQDACYNAGPKKPVDVQKQWGCHQWPCFDPHMPHETRVYTRRLDLMVRTGKWLKG